MTPYYEKKALYRGILIISLLVLFILMVYSCTIGTTNIGIQKSFAAIVKQIPGLSKLIQSVEIENTVTMIVISVRLPRIILAALIGSSLAVVGATLQGIFKNPMADPYVLGISSGASLCAAIGIITGISGTLLGIGAISVFSMVGAVVTMGLVYQIARVGTRLPTASLLLSGIAVGLFFSSVVTVIMAFRRDKIDKIVLWTMGSVSAASWSHVLIAAFFLIPLSIPLFICMRDLNVLSTGDETAKSLGIEVERTRKVLLFAASSMIGVCVSVSGVIGFVGLIIPHAIRLIFKSDFRVLLPFSAVFGAVFLIACDMLARGLLPAVMKNPTEIPVGAITAFIGAPLFVFLLMRSKKRV